MTVPKVSYVYNARVLKVVDGDTVDVDADLGFYHHQKMRLRLKGVDAPEKKIPTYQEGVRSRDELRTLIENKQVLIETSQDTTDKYGRFLADVYLQEGDHCLHINRWLIDKGLARLL